MAPWNETVYLCPLPPPESPLRLKLAGITHPDPDYRIARREMPDMYVLEYVLRGKGHLSCGGEYYTLTAGDVYFLQPGMAHEYYSDPVEPWEKVWFNISGKLVDSLCEAYRLHGLVYFRNCLLEKEFMEALKLVRHGGNTLALAFDLQIHRILAKLREWQDRHPEMLRSADGIRLKEFLDLHWHEEDLSVEALARAIRKSPAQVRRIFRRDWQMTPHRYLCRQRLFYACQYLENTSCPIKELAGKLGFRDEFYFSNWFRKEKGIAPREYRKQFR